MRFNYLNLLLFFGCLLAVNAGDFRYNISYFEVPIDHFSFASNQTFKIRLVNDLFFSFSFKCFLSKITLFIQLIITFYI